MPVTVPNPAGEPTPTAPTVSTPVRCNAVVRIIMALRETGIQLILATIITVGAGISAWILAATAFAEPPRLAVPPRHHRRGG